MSRNRDIKLDPKELDRLQRAAMMDMNWFYGSMNRGKPSLDPRP